eukprot:gene8669-9552_t
MAAWIVAFLIFLTFPLLCWGKAIAFWHIFTSGTHFNSIVHAQAKVINDSGLYDHLDHIYYTVVGSANRNVSFSGSKYSLYKNHGRHGNEVQTLKLVYDYCQEHDKQSSSSGAGSGSDVKILYFHNKGSFHPTPENEKVRQLLDCFVLSPDCLSVLDDYDTCGMRFAPLPFLHYSGNFWWSTCNHINKLIDPAVVWKNVTFLINTHKQLKIPLPAHLTNSTTISPKEFASAVWKNATFLINTYKKLKIPVPAHLKNSTTIITPKDFVFYDNWCIGTGRFFAEAWIGSLPVYRPADCMRSSVDKRYIIAYFDLPNATSVCPRPFNNRSKSDEKICGLSEFVNNSSYFWEGLESTYKRHSRICKDMAIHTRTLDWYGQPATLLYQMLVLPSNILFRANGWSHLFYSLNGTYYKVTNTVIMQALGFQKKDIIEKIPRYHLYVMQRGKTLSLSDAK